MATKGKRTARVGSANARNTAKANPFQGTSGGRAREPIADIMPGSYNRLNNPAKFKPKNTKKK